VGDDQELTLVVLAEKEESLLEKVPRNTAERS